MNKPKIFIFINGGFAGCLVGEALAEDGTFLGSHASSNPAFVEFDMGLRGPTWSASEAKLNAYAAHYPDGYELVNLAHASWQETADHPGLKSAIERANAATSVPLGSKDGET